MDPSFKTGSMLSLLDQVLVIRLLCKNGESTTVTLQKFHKEKTEFTKKLYFIEWDTQFSMTF